MNTFHPDLGLAASAARGESQHCVLTRVTAARKLPIKLPAPMVPDAPDSLCLMPGRVLLRKTPAL